MLSHRLNQREAQLRLDNAQLRQQNQQYTREILSIASGAGVEEQARLNGYARPDEKVFLIVGGAVARPTPQPSPKAAPAPAHARAPAKPMPPVHRAPLPTR